MNRLEFNENTYTSNLTSVLAYYVYLILGFDYDSFSLNGGDKYFLKAQKIVSNAQNDNNVSQVGNLLKVQKMDDWLVENLLNPDFTNMRASFFSYHREGMDNFTEKPDLVKRENIADALIKLLMYIIKDLLEVTWKHNYFLIKN